MKQLKESILDKDFDIKGVEMYEAIEREYIR